MLYIENNKIINWFTEFPVIETERLVLCRIDLSFVPAVFELMSNENAMKFYDCFPFTTYSEAENLIHTFENRYNNCTGIRWGIILKETGAYIGDIGFNSFQPGGNAVVGYALNEYYWNKGLVSEALASVIYFGFYTLQIHRIEAYVSVSNYASEKVLLKNGFAYEGFLRDVQFFKNQYQSLNLFSKIKEY